MTRKVSLLLLFLAGAAAPALGGPFSWTPATNGTFSDGSHWSPLGPPGSADDAIFNLTSGVNTISFTASADTASLTVGGANIKLALGTNTYDAGAVTVGAASKTSKVSITNGTVKADSTFITSSKANTTAVTVDGSSGSALFSTGDLTFQGVQPALNVTNGGQVVTSGTAKTVAGVISIDGTGSKWTVDTIIPGSGLNGSLDITNSGKVVTNSITTAFNHIVSIETSGVLQFTGSADFGYHLNLDSGGQLIGQDSLLNLVDAVARRNVTNDGTITLGALEITGSGSLRNSGGVINGDVNLVSGGRINGPGTINGHVDVASTTSFSPQDVSVQPTYSMESMTWHGGSTIFHFMQEPSVGLLSGVMSLDATSANPITINVFPQLWNYNTDPHDFTLITADGGITGYDPAAFTFLLNSGPNGSPYRYSVEHVGNSLVLHVAIPEPSSLVMGLLAALSLGAVVVKRRARVA